MKKFLLIDAFLAVLIAAPVTGCFALNGQDTAKTYPQENQLTIPTLIDSLEAGNDIELVMQNSAHEFFSGIKSPTKGYSQSYLGPTIRLYKGETTRIVFRNDIEESSTVHGHGLHVEGKVDGGPQGKILAGEAKRVVLPIVQEAGTSWYHPHLMGKTAGHVHAGLSGLYLIEDENSQTLPLPKNYGVNDIPLIVQDRSFVDGKMKPYAVRNNQITDGLREETLVVNGTINPYHKVPAGWVRLRLLNASNARFYRFFFSDDTPFFKIATEGGFLNKPIEITEITMSPGERNEIMIDLSNYNSLSLMAEFLPSDPKNNGWLFSNPVQRVVDVRVDTTLLAQGELPNKLNDISYYNQADMQTAVRRTFTLDMGMRMRMGMRMAGPMGEHHNILTINGSAMNMSTINERVTKGKMELWTITADMMPHPFHVHGVSFQIVTHNGQPPATEDQGWKDTLVVTKEPSEILMRFNHIATDEFPYMYHCHILEHEDAGMMGQFTVAE